METTTPSPPPISPHEDVENDNCQPPTADSQPQAFVLSPPLLVEDVEHHHQQFMDSISSNLLPSPENSVDRQQPPPPKDGNDQQENPATPSPPPPEAGNDQQENPAPPSPPPEEKIIYREQPFAPPSPASFLPPSPPSTEAEHPPENPNPNHQYPLSKQPPSPPLSPSPPQTEVEYPPENLLPNYEYPTENLSHNHESPLSKEPSSTSPSPSPSGAEYPPEKLLPNHKSPPVTFSPNHKSPLSKQPPSPLPTEAEYPSENLRPNHESPPENLRPNHESPLSKPSPSPSPSTLPTLAEDPVESPNYRINPYPNSDHESPSSPEVLQGNPKPSSKSIESPKDLSPSPPLITGSPSSQQDTLEPNTLTPPLGVPLLLHATATFSPNKPQISPWTHQETANLIQAYQEKWYSLKKGPLKAGQWEEVAITVATRCGYDEPTKTSKQCRHKIEKLRKRYRSERGKPRSKATGWNFFKLMDNLEKGPFPISSSQPMALVEYQKPSNLNGKKRKNDVYDDDGDHEFHVNSRSRNSNHHHHVANGGLARNLRFSDSGNRVVRGLRTPVVHKREEIYQEQEENNENGGEEEEDVATQLAAEIKGFAKKFVKMENSKIEMMRDVERYRLEMENKRIEMILESQQMLVETVNNAFSSSVKTHKLSAS